MSSRVCGASERDHQDVTSNGPLDAADLGEIATERQTDEALDKVTEHRLRTVERALQKIPEGTYGLSDLSGKEIPQERLQTVPEAIYNVDEESPRESDAA
jgi:DnaK suppressor protein